jgi:hypothetical protein
MMRKYNAWIVDGCDATLGAWFGLTEAELLNLLKGIEYNQHIKLHVQPVSDYLDEIPADVVQALHKVSDGIPGVVKSSYGNKALEEDLVRQWMAADSKDYCPACGSRWDDSDTAFGECIACGEHIGR